MRRIRKRFYFVFAALLLVAFYFLQLWLYSRVLPRAETQYWRYRENRERQPKKLRQSLNTLSYLIIPIEQVRVWSQSFYMWTEGMASANRGAEWKERPIPCKGLWRQMSFFESGQLKSEEHFKSHKRHGMSKQWNKEGRLVFEAYYKNGLQHGPGKLWTDEGCLWSAWYSVDGLLEGVASQYKPDGSIKARGIYRKGKPWNGSFMWTFTEKYYGNPVKGIMTCTNGTFLSAQFTDGRPLTNAYVTMYGCNLESQTMHLAEVNVYFENGQVSHALNAEGKNMALSDLERPELQEYAPFKVDATSP